MLFIKLFMNNSWPGHQNMSDKLYSIRYLFISCVIKVIKHFTFRIYNWPSASHASSHVSSHVSRILETKDTNHNVEERNDEDDGASDVVEDVGSSLLLLIIDVKCSHHQQESPHHRLKRQNNYRPL